MNIIVKILVALSLVASMQCMSDESLMFEYKHRAVDQDSKIQILRVANLDNQKIFEVAVTAVRLTDEKSGTLEKAKDIVLFVTEHAFLESTKRESLILPSTVPDLGDISRRDNTMIWTLPIPEILDELDFLANYDQPSYTNHPISGQWVWHRGEEGCFDNYVFNDSMEFTTIHGNTLISGTYTMKSDPDSDNKYFINLNIVDRNYGDISCGPDWVKDNKLNILKIKATIGQGGTTMFIEKQNDNSVTLGPFNRQ